MTDSTWAESDASNTAPLGHCGPEEHWKLEKRRGNNYPVVLIPALLASQKCGGLPEGMGCVKR